MSSTEEKVLEKLDYRILEINNISRSADVSCIIITNRPPASEIIEDIKKTVNVLSVFSFLSTIKAKGKVKDFIELANKDYVKFIMLDEVLVKLEELM
ncbi:hypothetical protein [Sulfolobus acidocaldarius]|uniref:Conserved protein n=4 Tax=Sulfolobus acidocaldarius TaxID=2285 RepID=Q4JC69_SULAC|nr:hypothetical protein [Sulfolobus acidocaldarius]AAY79610.1 conserved protein [Sulfolobus acidocaldarius DSM 639]AGE70164.1 hypothetical protein SacN8_00915 [Sulfolobus acidocaldarius N8]AGE72439.1 hypothetical protein SacRon12I_00915 [Sulfolobus acidocaldarius Ron12/I]ALU29425.1 hypothetical protein ATY89_05330 [Sulfolobus acidocaldarius]ALU32153.1 hypothetical protein ATZ20_08350 [Sulfolobus acidocaldarius]